MPYTYTINLTVDEKLSHALRDGLCDVITEVVEGDDVEVTEAVAFVSGPIPVVG